MCLQCCSAGGVDECSILWRCNFPYSPEIDKFIYGIPSKESVVDVLYCSTRTYVLSHDVIWSD
jgi:hypothetical protein